MLVDLPHEEFWIVLLNRQNAIIGQKCVSIGGMSSTIVDPKIIFRIALQEKASSIILAHNHPSGNFKPSDSDKRITRILVESGKVLDLLVLDHVIISQDGFYSFADNSNM
jgi:DNA repair protein RadC